MNIPKERGDCWLLFFTVGVLAAGCASSASSHREDSLGTRETVAQQPDEGAYREAAAKLLKYLDAQRKAGTGVVQVSGKDGIYPMYECMEYGCPDRVYCEEANVYCHVTHCGKRSCSFCPKPLPDVFKNLVFKQWCQFDCLRGSVRAGVAFGFVPSIGKDLFVGPYCLNE